MPYWTGCIAKTLTQAILLQYCQLQPRGKVRGFFTLPILMVSTFPYSVGVIYSLLKYLETLDIFSWSVTEPPAVSREDSQTPLVLIH